MVGNIRLDLEPRLHDDQHPNFLRASEYILYEKWQTLDELTIRDKKIRTLPHIVSRLYVDIPSQVVQTVTVIVSEVNDKKQPLFPPHKLTMEANQIILHIGDSCN